MQSKQREKRGGGRSRGGERGGGRGGERCTEVDDVHGPCACLLDGRFKERTIARYEDRIRAFSTPDKVSATDGASGCDGDGREPHTPLTIATR